MTVQRATFGRLPAVTTVLLALLAAMSLTVRVASQAVQLRDGTVLVGEVVDANSEGLSFRRLDNGGLLELRWDDLSTLFAERIRRAEGLVVEEDSLVTVQADVITFKVAGITEEVTGIAEWTDDFVRVKRKSGVLPIPRRSISDIDRRPVPVLEIYTADEWYQKQLTEIAPGEDADAHIRLADEMRRVGLFEQAVSHLEKADELGGGKQSAQLPAMLRRAKVLAGAKAERDMLSEIRMMRNRKDFSKAQELIESFQQQFPETDLKRELEREVRQLGSARELYLAGRMWQLWDRTVRTLANSYSISDSNSFNGARSYAEDRMGTEVITRIAGILEMEVAEAEALWAKRLEFGFNRSTLFSYGVGSWMLGEDAVIKDTPVASGGGAAGGKQGGGQTAEDRELERLVRKIREAQERSRQLAQRRSGGGEQTEEDWWEGAGREAKTAWLRAYFAEFSGYMEVVRAHAAPCANSDGRGYIEELGASGKMERVKCPVCHGTKYTRAIRAR